MKEMKMPRVSFVYDRKKLVEKGRQGVVEIEIYHNRKRLWLSTGIHLTPKQWRNDGVINHADSYKLNSLIREQYETVNNRIAELYLKDEFELDKLRGFSFVMPSKIEKVENPLDQDLFKWMEQRIAERPLRESTRKQHMTMMKVVKESGIFKTFADINTVNVKRLDVFLHSYRNANNSKNKQTTVYGYHKRFKIYIHEAMQYGILDKDPYTNVKISRGKADVIKYLTDDEKKRLEKLKTTGTMEMVRDMFLFACYTGLSYSDLVKIKKEDVVSENGNLYIEDKRQKTDSHYKLMLLPKAIEILKKYEYNLNLVSDQKCNLYLKMIATYAKIDKHLTFHMGRHTFATWALRHGIKIEVVSKMLAHSDIKTTQGYAKVLQESVDEGFKQLCKIK